MSPGQSAIPPLRKLLHKPRMSDATLQADLEWLEENAFECIITINGHRASFVSVADEIRDRDIDDDEWTHLEAKADAIATNRLIGIIVYPNGSVSSYSVCGVNLVDVARRARILCEEDQLRWTNNGMIPIHKQ